MSVPMISEWTTTTTILEHLCSSDTGSTWDRFVRRFRPPVIRFARRMGLSRPDAEDVAQETLLAFAIGYRNGSYDRSRGRLSKWLFGIAQRQVLDTRRKLARRKMQIESSNGRAFWLSLHDRSTPTDAWDREWELACLQTCLDRVRSEVRPATFRLFELVVYGRYSPADTASALGISVKAVYNAKHRVLKRIRELRTTYDSVFKGDWGDALP